MRWSKPCVPGSPSVMEALFVIRTGARSTSAKRYWGCGAPFGDTDTEAEEHFAEPFQSGKRMKMNDSPTADQLRTLIAPMDVQAGHHIVWIDKSDAMHVDTLDVDIGPIAFEKKHLGDMLFRYQTLDQRNGYVEAKAAVNDSWIARLLRELVQGWTERETSTVHHLGLSLMQGLAK